VLDDRVHVNGQVRRLADAAVFHRVLAVPRGLVELDHRGPEDGRGHDPRLTGLVDHVHLVRRACLDDVDAARDQLGDLGGLLGNDSEPHVLEVGFVAQ
jgi:hypothetical protein